MHIVTFTHPSFLGSQSMPRFAAMLANGMKEKGHQTEIWSPEAFFYQLPLPKSLKKWMGYIDQYILFPAQVRSRLKRYPADTLFVFADQALGPWIPLVAKRPHVIHCHDFLAQRSALGQIAENPTSATGKKYQEYIRRGYAKGKNFISVSIKTQQDLHELLGHIPQISKVIYNGLNQNFAPGNAVESRKLIEADTGIGISQGYILHVGGNQWYKNRPGVIKLYNAWRKMSNQQLPLLLLGAVPSASLQTEFKASPYQNDIHFLVGKSDDFVQAAYCGAAVFLFPSLAEGFGWPIAEAMASGCPVVTTGLAPMTEVGGDAAFYIDSAASFSDKELWAATAASTIDGVINMTATDRLAAVNKGLENAGRFKAAYAIDQIEEVYQRVLLLK